MNDYLDCGDLTVFVPRCETCGEPLWIEYPVGYEYRKNYEPQRGSGYCCFCKMEWRLIFTVGWPEDG